MPHTSAFLIGTILSLQTLSTCVISTLGQYIYGYYLNTYPIPPNSTTNLTTLSPIPSHNFLRNFNDKTKQCLESDISPNNDAQAWAQQQSASLFFWTNLCNSCPVILMTYLLGLYTPKLGERFVLILPMIGTLGQFAIWLAIIYFHLPEYWWYISAIVIGLSGSSSVLSKNKYAGKMIKFFSSAFVLSLIITDSTNEEDLSARFVRLGALQTGVSAIGTFAIGYYISWRGFTDLYWIGVGLQFLSILIVIFGIKSSNSNTNERTPLLTPANEDEFKELSSTTCSHFFQVCTVFRLNRRTHKKSASLFLTLFSNIFYTLAISTFAPFLWFLLNAPFCWSSKEIGNYSALASISYAILSVLGMQALTAAGASDAIICFISHLFFFASSLWSAFAQYNWELYAGLLVGAFSGYQGSLTISMMSKCLEPHERTNAFTFVTEVNTIINAFGTTFFNWVYARTVVNYRNFTLLLCAAICILPAILNL